jgi:cytochrome P450
VADGASAEVDAAVMEILERLRDHPDGSILSRMLHSEVDGEVLTDQEICSNLKVMIVGGMQEPGDLVGIAMWALLSHPDQAAAVLADANLIKPAIEESLRWQSPVGTSTRQTTRPTTLAGVDLDAGALIAAVVASANRDERHWPDPDRFDVSRKDGANLAFAIGSHHCVGAWLARYESRAAVRLLLEKLTGLRLDAERPIELRGWEFRRPMHLHVRWDT